MDTNFTPAVPLNFWTQKILPLVYDDSISYLEFLGKVNFKLTELIENINEIQTFLENSEIDPETNATKDYVNQQITASSAAINSTIQAVKTELQAAITSGDSALDTKINEVDSTLQAKITEHYTVVQSQIDNVNTLITSTAEATLNSAKADATTKVNALGALASQGRLSATITDWDQCVQNGTYYVDLVRALGFASAPQLDSSITTPTNGIAILKVHQSGDTTQENKSIQELDYFWVADDKTNFKSWCRSGSYSATTFTLEYGWLNTDIAGNLPVIPTDVATEEYVNRKISEALASYETTETADARYQELNGFIIEVNNHLATHDTDITNIEGDIATLQADSFLPRTHTSDNFNLILTPGTYSFVMPTTITQESWPTLDTSKYPAPSKSGFVTLNVYNAGEGGRITQTCTYSYLNSSRAINVSYTRIGIRSENGSLTVTYPWTESSFNDVEDNISKYFLTGSYGTETVSSITVTNTSSSVITLNTGKWTYKIDGMEYGGNIYTGDYDFTIINSNFPINFLQENNNARNVNLYFGVYLDLNGNSNNFAFLEYNTSYNTMKFIKIVDYLRANNPTLFNNVESNKLPKIACAYILTMNIRRYTTNVINFSPRLYTKLTSSNFKKSSATANSISVGNSATFTL